MPAHPLLFAFGGMSFLFATKSNRLDMEDCMEDWKRYIAEEKLRGFKTNHKEIADYVNNLVDEFDLGYIGSLEFIGLMDSLKRGKS